MTITAQIQSLEPGSKIVMYELDIRPVTGTNSPSDFIRFHDGVNLKGLALVWQGVTYEPFPIEVTGFEATTQGTIPRPRVRVSNVSGIISGLLRGKDDLLGAKLTRKRTYARYLDAVNFPGNVNPTADPSQFFQDDVYYVQRKVRENKLEVEWEMSSPLDLEGEMLPRRIITSTYCQAEYRSAEDGCPYAGSSYWDVNDQPVGSLAQDVCSKSVNGCKLRFPGSTTVLPFNGFPAARVYRT